MCSYAEEMRNIDPDSCFVCIEQRHHNQQTRNIDECHIEGDDDWNKLSSCCCYLFQRSMINLYIRCY